MKKIKSVVLVASAAATMLVLAQATPAAAQLANASARTLGLAQNNTATARGFGAISVNPAGLAMPGSGFSLALAPIRVRSGLDPITLTDLNDVAGTLVPATTKEAWLDQVAQQGGQSGSAGVRLTELALTVGSFGVQVSTIASANINLSPSIVEAILYGNAGRTGQPADLSLTGSSASGFAITTAGASIAFPLASPTGDMAIGVTGKYMVGHGVMLARDQGGSIQSNPIRVDVDFPMVLSSEDSDGVSGGSGVGLDVGFMMKRDNIAFGATVQNLVNTFEWDEAELAYRPGTASLSQGESVTNFDEQPLSAAPANLRNEIADQKFKPSLAVGVGLDVNDDFTVTGDLRNRFGDGIDFQPKFHLGAGAEYRGLRVLHLRAGAAVITDGIQLAGGGSLVLGPLNISLALALRQGDLEDTTIGQFALSFGNR